MKLTWLGFVLLTVFFFNSTLGISQKNKSGILLNLDNSEYRSYNSYYTQNLQFDSLGNKEPSFGGTQSFFTSNFNYFLGVDSFLDLGIEVNYRIASTDSTSRNGIVGIGPKIRFQPFGEWKSFLVQTTLLIPTVQNLEGTKTNTIFLDFDSYQFLNQFFLDKQLLKGLNLFAELGILARIDREFNRKTEWIFPTKLFLSTFPFKGATLYVMGEYSNSSFAAANLNGYYIQNGTGFKYQFKKQFEFEVAYTKFHTGKSTGAGSNFAIGIKYRN